ncbi:hypothetical protein JVT61DRAFT_9022 [Boletus reticuloceps]|uniref:Uncharacterized protein n=1 Tax=Boletus reticuloceps TaxID=495285 RepID=A0A8I3A6G9_9AGAM|nr:hypothetical protein JVT61DRAFT_9022 [Boletus reticuloceps]
MESKAHEFMQVSRAYQVILGLVQLDEDTTHLYVNPQMLESDKNKDSAFNVARRLVCQCYHLGGKNSAEDNSGIVTSILSNLLYYGTLDSSKVPLKIGDDVLQEVVCTLIFGFSGPTPLSLPFPGECLVGEASLAVQQIEKALREWQSGSFQPIGDTDIDVVTHFNNVKSTASKVFEVWQRDLRDKWSDFTSGIYSTDLNTQSSGALSWTIRSPLDT